MVLVFIFPLGHLHKEIACFFSTIGGDGIRQCRSDAAILAAVLRKSNTKSNRGENLQR